MSGGGASSRSSSGVAWGVGIAAALAFALVEWQTAPRRLLEGQSDEALLVPLAIRELHPALFEGDRWLALASEVFSHAYSRLLGTLLEVFRDPVTALRVLALPFQAVLLAGSFRVAERLGGRLAGGLAVGLLALPPLLGEVHAPGGALPRDLVFACVPWIWLAHARVEGLRSRAILGLAVGGLANLHPLTALHLVIVLLLDLALRRPPRLRHAAVCGTAFLVGALPYVIQYLALPRTAGGAPEAVLHWRVPGIGAETLTGRVAAIEPLAFTAAAAMVLPWVRGDATARPLLRFAGIASALAVAAPLLGLALPSFQFVRTARMALFAFVPLLAAGVRFELVGRRARVLAAAGLLLALLLGPVLVRVAATARAGTPRTGPDRGLLTEIAHQAERRLGLRPVPGAALEVPRHAGARRPGGDPDSLAGFEAVAAFARERTPPGTVFLVPPHDWGAFRAYGRRGAAVTRKEGGFALAFLGGRGLDWWEEYREAARTYAEGDGAAWSRLAARHGARYAVVEDSSTAPPWTPVLRAGPYRVLEAPRSGFADPSGRAARSKR